MAAPQKPRRPRRRQQHPVTKQELRDNNPSVAEAVIKRFSPMQRALVWIAGFVAGIAALWQVYTWTGAKTLVNDRELAKVVSDQSAAFEHKLGTVKTEVNTKIDSTKDDVLRNQNAIKGELTTSLGKLTETLGSVAKNQSAAAMDQADVQMRLAFTQKQSLQGQLAIVNQALAKDGNDQLALTRKMQLDDFIKQNDQYMQEAQQKMTRLRSGQ